MIVKTKFLMEDKIFRFLEDIGVGWKYLISGVLGATVWSVHKRKKFFDSLRNIVCGGIVSAYATPFLANRLDVNLSFLGFLVGIVGMNILDEIYLVIVKNKGKIQQIFKTVIEIIYSSK